MSAAAIDETDTVILAVEDDRGIRELLEGAFMKPYLVLSAATAAQARQVLIAAVPQLILLDIGLPDVPEMSLEFLREITTDHPDTWVVVLSGYQRSDLAADTLNEGAADYVEKPFDLELLEAKVEAILRRGRLNPPPLYEVGNLRIGSRPGEAWAQGRLLQLSRIAHPLLFRLAASPDEPVSSDELYRVGWNFVSPPEDNTMLRATISGLRRKLERANVDVEIHTTPGYGYYLTRSGNARPAQKAQME